MGSSWAYQQFPTLSFSEGQEFFPDFFLARAELERALFLSWALVRDGGTAGIFVAVWLDSHSSRLLSAPHRDSHSDAEAQPWPCVARPASSSLLSTKSACSSCSLRRCKWSFAGQQFAGEQSAGMGGVFVAWTWQKALCDRCCLSGGLCAARIYPSQCSPLELGQTSLFSSTKVSAEQLLFFFCQKIRTLQLNWSLPAVIW